MQAPALIVQVWPSITDAAWKVIDPVWVPSIMIVADALNSCGLLASVTKAGERLVVVRGLSTYSVVDVLCPKALPATVAPVGAENATLMPFTSPEEMHPVTSTNHRSFAPTAKVRFVEVAVSFVVVKSFARAMVFTRSRWI